jgi:prophage DNA circulation protein
MSYPRSASRLAEQRGRDAAAIYARLIAALAYARGSLRLDFGSRQQAQEIRERLVAVMEPLLDRAATEPDLFEAVVGAYGQALDALDAQILSLKPIVRVVTGESQPACLLAWQLYADTERAAELVRLNNARCPEFMPVELLCALPDDS